MRVALYGGSFDPPHLGHAQVVLHLLYAGFDEVWLIPAAVHPFGKELAPFAHRMRMLQLAMSDFGSRVRLCDVEIHLATPSWTIRTVEYLRSRYPEYAFSWVVGDDQNVDTWYRIEELRRLVAFYTVRRGPWREGDPVPSIPNYASSEIRRRLSFGQIPEGWMHVHVSAYIRQHGLYGVQQMVPNHFTFAIIGLGKVGGSLLFSLRSAGYLPRWCADLNADRWNAAQQVHVPVGFDWRALWYEHPVDCLIFCTPDTWRPSAEPLDWEKNQPLCLHTGGMHAPCEVFENLNINEDCLGILHPVLAVASPMVDLRGRLFSVTGNIQNLTFLHLLQALAADVLPVPAHSRPLFHALCTLLSNGAQVLEIETAGVLRTFSTSDVLVMRWVRQLVEGGLVAFLEHKEDGLTGPWVRGDNVTINQHLHTLFQLSPELVPLYQALHECVKRRLLNRSETIIDEQKKIRELDDGIES